MTLDPEAIQRNAFLQVLHGEVVVLLHRGHTDIRQQVHERDIVPFHSQREKKSGMRGRRIRKEREKNGRENKLRAVIAQWVDRPTEKPGAILTCLTPHAPPPPPHPTPTTTTRVQQGIFLPELTFSADSVMVLVPHEHLPSHLNFQTVAAIPLFRHKDTAHTGRNG